jgi:hypothetical protein
MPRFVRLGFLVACFWAANTASGAVTRIEITHREPYAEGRDFDDVGAYERLHGRAYFAVDPRLPANRRIVDLDLAAKNDTGLVEFSCDMEILAPVDLARARGTLLYDVNNRGNRLALQFNTGADEFLMRHGFIVVWSGWIAEVLPGDGRLRLEAPVARGEGGPITGVVRAEMAPDKAAERLNIAHWANQGSYEPTDRGVAEATLTRRLREADPRENIDREAFRIETRWIEQDGKRGQFPLVELALEGGFQPGYLYELIYEAQNPVVQGAGLAGIRDLVSFLRYDASESNPLARDGESIVQCALGFGVSQSGRCLRMFLYDGFQADEEGRPVFDGLMPHVAGAGRGFFNHRFASPTRHNTQHDNHTYPTDVFPFTYGEATDPFTGRTDSILRRPLEASVVPKIMHVQTSAEYWHRGGSLVHTDPSGERDAEIPPEVRIYAIGGAQHGPGSGVAGPASTGQLPHNPIDYRPLLRGLLMALEVWARDGREPPPSVYPRIADGTLVDWRGDASGWRSMPGFLYPEVIHAPAFCDYGPQFQSHRRITRHPPLVKGAYRVLVPAYGEDNNERGMLLLPPVAVPLATYTGWNLRAPSLGAETELLSLAGGYIPFARTGAERQASGDPRKAILERYHGFEDYLSNYQAVVEELVRGGYLLQENVPRLMELVERQREVFEK